MPGVERICKKTYVNILIRNHLTHREFVTLLGFSPRENRVTRVIGIPTIHRRNEATVRVRSNSVRCKLIEYSLCQDCTEIGCSKVDTRGKDERAEQGGSVFHHCSLIVMFDAVDSSKLK